ncbi:MAG: hypothetical protein H7146_00265 [Burkholderiaceae bacterium]|nr:hypothetical protein [Microbacteriaceae bacterium]
MKSALWLIVGVGLGFAAAHQINRTTQGRAFFENVGGRVDEFTSAVRDGYTDRSTELRTAVDEAEDIIAGLTNKD